ncbi:MAG: hypothetical protein JST84_22655 [Acidobacteria bacterium]|nr:hypothetical protein [Acidobacteriota bacterium]
MQDITLESVYQQAKKLPPEDQQKLVEAISTRLRKAPLGKRVHPAVPYKDRSREQQWLRENSHLYIGEWLALDDGKLVAHGKIAKEVFAEARAQGYERPLTFFVADPATPDPVIF